MFRANQQVAQVLCVGALVYDAHGLFVAYVVTYMGHSAGTVCFAEGAVTVRCDGGNAPSL